MILVRDYIDDIVDSCFSLENAEVLEFVQNGNKVTIKDQFLYHYESACYTGTIEGLKKAIMYKIFQNEDILIKIADYKENIRRIIDLGEYSKVALGYKDQLGSETSVGASGSQSETTNIQADQYSGVEQNENLNINDERIGTSQSNLVEGLNVVIPQPSINPGDTQNIDSYTTGDTVILKGQKQYNKPYLSNPQSNEQNRGYQNVTKDITTNQTNNTLNTISSRGSEAKTKHKNLSTNTRTKGTKTDEITRNVEFRTNDARLKIWKTELPRLQLKFWNSFYNLFIYEQC